MLRERAGLPAGEAPRPAAPAPLALRIEVSVAPELAGAVAPGDALFVFAQDPAGPPMPLAVQRLSAAQLPATVTLDDTTSMTPDRKLSSVGRWRVVARISRSGNAVPQPGDLEGSLETDRAGAAAPLKLVISRRRP
jgi:cytochrome c-type biogenesis protein CcmH